jgi:hypothetical protein|tara:strand:+ start:125 stop:544 length:420 start_codon:yes stop_codon:yes gene_type:complete
MKNKLLLISLLLLPGCSVLSKFDEVQPLPPVTIITEEVRLEIFQPALPNALSLENVRWYVITENNMEEKVSEIETDLGGKFTVFAMTPQGYENMAYNMQELRRYILQQKEIILYYREATKPDEGDTAEEWLEQNERERE